MRFSSLFTVIRHWLRHRPAFAPCLLVPRRRWLMAIVWCVVGAVRLAPASVLVTGDVTPANNPFTAENEGIPTDGNFINPFERPNPAGVVDQTYFEGRHSDGANLADPADDTNINFDVKVGTTGYGTLLISGESALRDQHLYIGDSGLVNNVMRVGTGVVRITGFGSLYNNNPDILPAEVQAAIAAGYNFQSVVPRMNTVGFDMYVGRNGTGTLEISAGARAEIQDAVVVADAPASTGNLIVDGLDSFLGSGGFEAGGSVTNDPHAMLIGRQGVGIMTITNGGTVRADAPTGGSGSANIGPIGAVLGSDPFRTGTQDTAGGVGTVTVDGNASKWIIGGSLQVGGFDIGSQGMVIGDPEGDDVVYNSFSGRGTLYVQAGGLVNVVNSIDADPTDPKLLLAIGRFGRVHLAGGSINVGGATGQSNEARPNTVQLINDGVISGSGRITTGVFNNRYYGEIRVGAGENLLIDSASDFSGTALQNTPLANHGRIEVLGTADSVAQLEFVRIPNTTQTQVQPFLNLPLTTAPTQPAFEGGLINAQHAILRFGSGIQNQGVMAFTAGTNVVSGQVVNVSNEFASPDDGDVGDSTQILVSGPSTQVIFEDDLSTGEGADINLVNGGNIVVLDQHSFAGAGNIGIELSYEHPSLIAVAGDVGIGSGPGGVCDLTINLANDVLQTLEHGDTFQIISFGGDIGGVDLTDPLHPVVDLSIAPLFTDIEVSPDLSLVHPTLDPVVQFSNEGVYVAFFDPMMVGSGAIAPDFNGDGVVDGADLAIWLAHVGIDSGASILDGDADGDGDVDGDDFLFWQRNVGRPMPWTGSGSGAASAAAVPEPATALVLFLAVLLALPGVRWRAAG